MEFAYLMLEGATRYKKVDVNPIAQGLT